MKTLGLTLISALLLLSVLVGLKVCFEHHLAPTTSGIHGELHGPKTDVLLLGSSHTRQGYDAGVLEAQTGKAVYVMGYDGLDPVSMIPLVKTLLADASRRPSLLVLEANSASLARKPDIQEPRLFFDAPPAMKLDLARTYLATHHGVDAWLDVWSLAANRGSELILTWPLVHGAIDRLSYHGSYVNKTAGGCPPEIFPSLRIPIAGSQPDPLQWRALEELFAVVAAYHVPVLLADPPMAAPVEAQPEVRALQDVVRALAARDGVAYYQGADDFPIHDPALFHDSNHLSTAGRKLYSEQFSAMLKGKDLR